MVQLLHYCVVLVVCKLSIGVELLRRELSDYPLAQCNDGTTAAYYHDKDVRGAGSKVLLYLPDGGSCNSVPACTRRCQESPSLCSGSVPRVLDKKGGIWDTASPLQDYFKIMIHYCSSDSFAGTKATGNITFHGHHILMATLQDVVARLGIDRAGSVVLSGSGSGARGVGYNCDFVTSAMTGINPGVDVRCLADGPDFVPWWVKTQAQQCGGEDLHQLESEMTLWGRVGDSSCVRDNEGVLSPALLARRCGWLSQYWQDIATPLLIVASMFDPVYYSASRCTPSEDSAGYARYRAAWERGLVALGESVLASQPSLTSIFLPSCAGHALLSGSLAKHYTTQVQVGQEGITLNDLMTRWLGKESIQAIDTLGRKNSQCPVSAPLKAPCGNLLGCGTRQTDRNNLYHSQTFNRRLLPPASLFPTTYTRNCALDPWYGSCGRQSIPSVIGDGHGVGLGHHGAHEVLHKAAQAKTERRKSLWKKLYYLQFLKKLFQKYRLAYAREYHGSNDPVVVREKVVPTIFRPSRPRVIVAPRRLPSVVTIERPPAKLPASLPNIPAPDYDYASVDYDYAGVDYDYALNDYADYYDYAQADCNAGCPLSKIVKAIKLKKKKDDSGKANIRAGTNRGNGELLKRFKEFLEESDVEYEDFGPPSSEVETFDEELLKLQERRKALI